MIPPPPPQTLLRSQWISAFVPIFAYLKLQVDLGILPLSSPRDEQSLIGVILGGTTIPTEDC